MSEHLLAFAFHDIRVQNKYSFSSNVLAVVAILLYVFVVLPHFSRRTGKTPNQRGLLKKIYIDFIQRLEEHFNEVFVLEVDICSLK